MRYRTIILLAALLAFPKNVVAQNSVADDINLLLSASLTVPGIAAYCNLRVEKNEELLDSAKRWNDRNQKTMQAILREVEANGGISEKQKKDIDVAAFQVVSKLVSSEDDRSLFCKNAAKYIDTGNVDLDKQPHTAAALARLIKKR